jgi:hypothetical protein
MTRDDIEHLVQVAESAFAQMNNGPMQGRLRTLRRTDAWAIHASKDNPRFSEQAFHVARAVSKPICSRPARDLAADRSGDLPQALKTATLAVAAACGRRAGEIVASQWPLVARMCDVQMLRVDESHRLASPLAMG